MTNQADPNIPAEQLPWAVAGAWKPCPNEGRKLSLSEINKNGDCALCHGTGRIYTLPDKNPVEFNAHAAIKALARLKWPCPDWVDDSCLYPSASHAKNCDGTGYVIPFKALRVPCLVLPHDGAFLHYTTGEWCEGRGWFPEPDVEKACWRVMQITCVRLVSSLPGWKALIPAGGGVYKRVAQNDFWALTAQEAVLRAALAWAKEQHE